MFAILKAHYAGRIGRLSYLCRVLLYILLFAGVFLLMNDVAHDDYAQIITAIVLAVYAKLSLLGAIAQRLASMRQSRWWMLVVLVPYLNILFAVGLMFPPEAEEQVYALPPLPPFKMPKLDEVMSKV